MIDTELGGHPVDRTCTGSGGEGADLVDPGTWSETRQALYVLEGVPRALRSAGCGELLAVADWADLHPGEGVPAVRVAGQERAVQVGGDGTPVVAEFAVAEMAAVLDRSVFAGRRLLADALDLRHRLPRLWRRVERCEVEAWQARAIAQATRPLTLAQARRVDSRVADQVGRLAWSRMATVVDAAVIAADPDRAARLAEQARAEAKVHIGQTDAHGLATVYARVETADAVWLSAQVHRLADLLATVRGDSRPVDQRRATALGLLARPADAIALLLASQPEGGAEPNGSAADPAEPDDSEQGRSDTDAIVERIGALDPRTLAPPITLYAHVAWESLATGAGVCRMEGIGPMVAVVAQRWLGDAHVTVKPVIDLPAGQMPVDAYELPPLMREHLQLRQPFSVHPYGVTGARRADADHSRPYRWTATGAPAEPGQTGLHNVGPLARLEHRLVTHGRWQRRQPVPGTHLVRAPHGHTWLITNTGTHQLGSGSFADAVWGVARPCDRHSGLN